DADLLRLHFGLLGDDEREDAVAQLGLHVLAVDALGQREAPAEAAERPLVGVEALALLALLGLAATGHRETILGEGDIEILLLDAGEVGLEHVAVLALEDLEAGNEAGLDGAPMYKGVPRLALVIEELEHDAEGIPEVAGLLITTNDSSHCHLLLLRWH